MQSKETVKSVSEVPNTLPKTAHRATRIIQRIAEKVGAVVDFEPEFGHVGSITFPEGGYPVFFKGTHININRLASVEIANDKAYASFFLRKFGYRTPQEQTFFSDDQCRRINNTRNTEEACRYASELGYPVIVKPNDQSLGRLVAKAHSDDELRTMATKIFELTNVMLVQKLVTGSNYRIVALDDEIICAYQCFPLCVIGDGRSSIQQLLEAKQTEFKRQQRDTAIDLNDFRIAANLGRKGLEWSSVPSEGQRVPLLDNSNLSTGGEAKDVTSDIHPDYRVLATEVTGKMGLRFCGVDIMTSDLTQPLDPNYHIIEINATPGMDHYALSGHANLDELYLKVLQAASKVQQVA